VVFIKNPVAPVETKVKLYFFAKKEKFWRQQQKQKDGQNYEF